MSRSLARRRALVALGVGCLVAAAVVVGPQAAGESSTRPDEPSSAARFDVAAAGRTTRLDPARVTPSVRSRPVPVPSTGHLGSAASAGSSATTPGTVGAARTARPTSAATRTGPAGATRSRGSTAEGADSFGVGVDLVSGLSDPSAVISQEATFGPLATAQGFLSWGYAGHPDWNVFPSAAVTRLQQLGITPEITWDPTITGADADQQRSMTLATIAGGGFDGYLRTVAAAVASTPGTVLIRLGHEMNGTWVSWSDATNGNHGGDFVAMWRHVVTVFRQLGVTNVRWIWSPNVEGRGTTPLRALYPGDSWVDLIGLDGYSYPVVKCPALAAVFGPTIAAIRAFADRPVELAEVGVSTQCPDRAGLVTSFVQWVTAPTTGIVGFTWWDRAGDGNDYTLLPGSAAALAMRSALRTSVHS